MAKVYLVFNTNTLVLTFLTQTPILFHAPQCSYHNVVCIKHILLDTHIGSADFMIITKEMKLLFIHPLQIICWFFYIRFQLYLTFPSSLPKPKVI